jgi:hypothetical protein
MPKKKQTRKKVTEAKKNAKKKLDKVRKVRNIHGAAWKTWERAWAEDGVIKIQDKETGEIQHLTPRDAAVRAQAINGMLGSQKIPWAQREKAIQFVSKIIEIIKEAKHQGEAPSNTNERIISNVLAGKTAEGRELKPMSDPEEMLKFLCFKYPMLSESEIKQVCNEQIPQQEKTGILQTINADRLMEIVQQNEAHKQQQ